MTPAILSSPYLNASIIDTLLARPCTPEQRIQLLSARLHLLCNAQLDAHPLAKTVSPVPPEPHSSPATSSRISATENVRSNASKSTLPAANKPADASIAAGGRTTRRHHVTTPAELRVRLDLGTAYASLTRPGWKEAEAELATVEDACKRDARARAGALRNETGRTHGSVDGDEVKEEANSDNTGAKEEAACAQAESIVHQEAEREAERNTPGETEEDRKLRAEFKRIRIEALGQMILVEEALGRDGRAKQRRRLLETLLREP